MYTRICLKKYKQKQLNALTAACWQRGHDCSREAGLVNVTCLQYAMPENKLKLAAVASAAL